MSESIRAVLTSLIATCIRLRIDPFAYLRDVFERISSHPKSRLDELLPDKWILARQCAPLGNISAEATQME
jgi:transposase